MININLNFTPFKSETEQLFGRKSNQNCNKTQSKVSKTTSKQTRKKIEEQEGFRETFGFSVPHSQIRAYEKFFNDNNIGVSFFRSLFELQFLKYDTDYDLVILQMNFVSKVETIGSALVSILLLVGLICCFLLFFFYSDILSDTSNLKWALMSYFIIYLVAFPVFLVNFFLPLLNAIRYTRKVKRK